MIHELLKKKKQGLKLKTGIFEGPIFEKNKLKRLKMIFVIFKGLKTYLTVFFKQVNLIWYLFITMGKKLSIKKFKSFRYFLKKF
jgi:hypothetical protein